MGGACNPNGGEEEPVISVGNPERKRLLGRPRLMWRIILRRILER
jgi:hypothetical protein